MYHFSVILSISLQFSYFLVSYIIYKVYVVEVKIYKTETDTGTPCGWYIVH